MPLYNPLTVEEVDGSPSSVATKLVFPNTTLSFSGSTATYTPTAASTVTYSNWTPALTATVTNPTLGTGSTADGRYFQNGKHVSAMGRIVFGTSGVVAGSGDYRLSLPVTAVNQGGVYGYSYLYDDSAPDIRSVMLGFVSTTTVQIVGDFTGIIVTNGDPWTWAANDAIIFHLDYEAA